MDREKVIKGLEELYGFLFREYANIPAEESKIYYERTCAIRDALELLKEQQNQIWEMQDRTEYLEDKLNEQPQIVRCKDCRWYDERISMCDNCGLPREQMFFCADGKRKEGR